jgi:hypothetical protein
VSSSDQPSDEALAAPSSDELLAALERWAQDRGFCDGSPQRRRGWSLELRADHVRVRRPGSAPAYVRLDLWPAVVWALLVECADWAFGPPEMMLQIVPGWRRKGFWGPSDAAEAEAGALRHVQPKGEWTFSFDSGRTLRGDGFYGVLRWYEGDPAPEVREQLSRFVARWGDEAVIFDDWRLSGSVGVCSVPEWVVACPSLGQWLAAHMRGETPSASSQHAALSELLASARRHYEVFARAKVEPRPAFEQPVRGWLRALLRR